MKRLFSFAAARARTAGATAPISAANEPKRGATLAMAMRQTPPHLNPAGQSGTQLFAAPRRHDKGWKTQCYSGQRVDRAMALAGSTGNQEPRQKYCAEFQHIPADEPPLHPLIPSPYRTVPGSRGGNAPGSIRGTSHPLDRGYLK